MASASGQRNAAVAGNAMFTDARNENKDVLHQTAQSALDAIAAGKTGALGALGTGYNSGVTALNNGIAGLNGYAANGNAANTAQADFLGLNGTGGNSAASAALDNFRNSTGYTDLVNQSTDAAARKAAALGVAGSGNTLDALARIGGNLADRSAQQYLTNLGTLGGQGLQASTSQLAGDQALASLGQTYGQNTANIDTNAATNTAGIYTGLGNSISNQNNIAAAGVNGNLQSAGAASDAAHTANGNLALGIAGTGLKLLSSGLSAGTGGLGSLGSLFGAGGGTTGTQW